METLSLLVQERNARETLPFAGIHGANALLWKQADAWQTKCLELEQKLVAQQESRVGDDADDNNAKIQYAESAALKNERKMREELDRLKAQVKAHEERHQKDSEDLRDANQQLSELKDLCKKQEQNLSSLTEKNEKQDKALEHLSTQVSDSEQRANLAEQQCVGLKDAIRMITEESSNVRKENEQLTTRFIEEKQRLSSEVNTLNEMLEKLRKESAELQTVKKQEEKRKSWFGFSTEDTTAKTATTAAAMKSSEISARQYIPNTTSLEKQKSSDGKKNPPVKVVVPSLPKQIIQAHRQEAACVRCTTSGTDRIATGGSFDGTVQVWNVTDGSILATLRGGYNNSITTVDITNRLVVGGGNDKTCRVWDIDTQRMLHQLVGHAQKITCVRFLANGQGVVTAAKDRQIKVWDISKQTYRQKTNIVLDSTANAVDVASDSFTLVSGHTNGSLRFWDIRTGEKNGEIASVHKSAITSVQFHPLDDSKVLTNGMDSVVKIVDVRTAKAVHEFKHVDFQTSYSWSTSVFSPDGAYVASGSSSNGFVFCWNTKNGQLVRVLDKGHQNAGVCGIVWGRGGDSGHQVATTDKGGKLIFWGC